MTDVLFGPKTPAPATYKEADLLAMLDARYGRTYANGPNEALRHVGAPHVRLDPGFSQRGQRIADYIAIDTWASSGYALHGHEVKVTRSDLLAELRQPEKAEAFARYCDYWWLVIPTKELLRPTDAIPETWGVMVVVAGSKLRVLRSARRCIPEPMPPSLVASFARSVAHARMRAAQ
jgi:hypothetical protein